MAECTDGRDDPASETTQSSHSGIGALTETCDADTPIHGAAFSVGMILLAIVLTAPLWAVVAYLCFSWTHMLSRPHHIAAGPVAGDAPSGAVPGPFGVSFPKTARRASVRRDFLVVVE